MSLKLDPKAVKMMPLFYGAPYLCNQPWKGGTTWSHGHFQPAVTNVVAIAYETDRKKLEDMIPDCYTLNEPIIQVVVCEFTNIGWANGKMYRLININCPVHFKGERDDLDGDLVLAMFENHCDPIVGGRELMGYSKIYCDIPPIQHNENHYISLASCWDFSFMKIDLDITKPAKDADAVKALDARSSGKVHLKYIPAVKEKDEPNSVNFTKADVCYPTILPKWVRPDDYQFELRKPEVTWCDGTITWYDAEWGDWPTNGQIAHVMANLPVKKVLAGKQFVYDEPCEYTHCYRLR